MVTIKLAKSWTYRTPEKTIDYPAGEHEVFQYIADAAEAEGALSKEKADGGTSKPAAGGKAGTADASQG